MLCVRSFQEQGGNLENRNNQESQASIPENDWGQEFEIGNGNLRIPHTSEYMNVPTKRCAVQPYPI